MKREAPLKSAFGAELKRQLPRYLALAFATAGAPDRIIVGAGHTTYWEFKHATPAFHTPGNQVLLCRRLAAVTYCRYVVWYEGLIGKRTYVVHPDDIDNWDHRNPRFDLTFYGHNHVELVTLIRNLHEKIL